MATGDLFCKLHGLMPCRCEEMRKRLYFLGNDISKNECYQLSEFVLKREWDTPEEDEAWKDL